MGDPAIESWAPGRIDVFGRGTDNSLWQRFSINNAWSAWAQPVNDGVLGSAPTAVAMAPGYLEVFVAGGDGNIYERWYIEGAWNSVWYPLGSPPGGAITSRLR